MMKILIINPNSDENTNRLILKKADAFSGGRYEVDVVCVKNAPKLVSSYEDHASSTDEMLEIVRTGQQNYDAFIVACHADPNLDLLKEISAKPVVGIAEASMHFASMQGNSFAVISPSLKSISKKWALARKYYCNEQMKTVQVSKSDDEKDLLEAARRAVEDYHVDVIVLGCANYANADRYLQRELKIPVVEGVSCALTVAAGMVMDRRYKQ